jgi:hypothetical protein
VKIGENHLEYYCYINEEEMGPTMYFAREKAVFCG